MTDARTVHHYESLARDAGWDGDALHVDRRELELEPPVTDEPETHHAWEWRELLADRDAQVTR